MPPATKPAPVSLPALEALSSAELLQAHKAVEAEIRRRGVTGGEAAVIAYDPQNRPKSPIDPASIKTGDVLQITHYVRVNASKPKFGTPSLDITDLHTGESWTRTGEGIIKCLRSADQFVPGQEIKLSRTQLADVLLTAGDRPFTVVWKTKDGEERTLRGRHVSADNINQGYSGVEDLDIDRNEKGGRFRQVDHRTVVAVVLDGHKYTLKGK
jgi:hypothetical protein